MANPWEGPVHTPVASPGVCSTCTSTGHQRQHIEPPSLKQGGGGDCWLIVTLNRIAKTPRGQRYLASLVKPADSGRYEVTLFVGDDDTPKQYLVAPPTDWASELEAVDHAGVGRDYWFAEAGAMGDPTLRVIEKAVAMHLEPARGNFVSERELFGTRGMQEGRGLNTGMYLLGLNLITGGTPSQNVDAFRATNGDGVFALGTARAWSPERTRIFDKYNLYEGHAYEFAGMYVERATGREMVIARNPYGDDHPKPVPVSEIDHVFAFAGRATIPGTIVEDY